VDINQANGMRLLASFGYSKKAIAELFGIGRGAVHYRMSERKPKRRGVDASRYEHEVKLYMLAHPHCTVFDVAMECHMTEKMARNLMRKNK
jgi:predicted DNA-binding protein YlxM (UPF0122 family)